MYIPPFHCELRCYLAVHAAVAANFLDGGGAGHFRRRRLAWVHGPALDEIGLRPAPGKHRHSGRTGADAFGPGHGQIADKRARLELEVFLRQTGFEQVEFR